MDYETNPAAADYHAADLRLAGRGARDDSASPFCDCRRPSATLIVCRNCGRMFLAAAKAWAEAPEPPRASRTEPQPRARVEYDDYNEM